MGFDEIGKNKEFAPDIYKVKQDYIAIGSGANYAHFVLRVLNRFYSSLNMKISDLQKADAVGFASYVINEVRQIDLEFRGLMQMSVIDEKGYHEITIKEQIKYHNVMVKNMSSLLNDNLSTQVKRDELLQRMFPRVQGI